MARELDVHHHTRIFEATDIEARLRQAVWHAEAPLKESYNTCSLLLSEMVHGQNMKVVLTGEGADELFGGYVGFNLSRPHDEDLELSLKGNSSRSFEIACGEIPISFMSANTVLSGIEKRAPFSAAGRLS